MEEIYPNRKSEASREGTMAHKVCEMLVTGEIQGFDCSREMFLHCEMYVNYIRKVMHSPNPAMFYQLQLEETINMESIHPDMYGTPDAWFFTENHLHIFDFKYGFKAIEVFENWQLIAYSAGIMEGEPTVDKVTFHIIQPRAVHKDGPIRTWSISSDELIIYWDRLRASEAIAATEDAPLTPGSGCEYCRARHACPALRKTVLERINMKDLPKELTDDELGKELKQLHDSQELLKARITALESEALAKLKIGKRIPFYQLGRHQPREKWVKPIAEILTLGEMFDVDLKKEPEAITPKQAIKAGIPADLVRQYSDTPIGELKLEQVKESETRKIFAK
jgi:hypothetical protein